MYFSSRWLGTGSIRQRWSKIGGSGLQGRACQPEASHAGATICRCERQAAKLEEDGTPKAPCVAMRRSRCTKFCSHPTKSTKNHVSNFQNLRNRRYYISGHQVSRSVSKSSGTIGSTRKNDTYIVYMYTCEMHKHDVAYCHTLQALIF